jgi:hypothetical protein
MRGWGMHGARCKRQGMMMDRVVKLLLAPANHPEHRNEDDAIQQRQRVVLHLANPMRAVVVWTGECKGTVAVGLHRGVRPGYWKDTNWNGSSSCYLLKRATAHVILSLGFAFVCFVRFWSLCLWLFVCVFESSFGTHLAICSRPFPPI